MKPLREQLAKLEAPDMAAKLESYREQQQEEQRLHSEIASLAQRIEAMQQAARERTPTTITVLNGKQR